MSQRRHRHSHDRRSTATEGWHPQLTKMETPHQQAPPTLLTTKKLIPCGAHAPQRPSKDAHCRPCGQNCKLQRQGTKLSSRCLTLDDLLELLELLGQVGGGLLKGGLGLAGGAVRLVVLVLHVVALVRLCLWEEDATEQKEGRERTA